MFEKAYYFFHRGVSRKSERGSYSSGYLQARVRDACLSWCTERKGRLLEVGCGEGLFLEAVLRANPLVEVTGVDIDENRVKQASQRCAVTGRASFSVQSGETLQFPCGSFDTVVCANVFLNCSGIDAVRRIIQEMSRVACAGAHIIVEFRNKRNFLQNVKFRLAPWYDKTVQDLPLNAYDIDDMSQCLSAAGCVIERILPLGGPKWFAPVLIMDARKI